MYTLEINEPIEVNNNSIQIRGIDYECNGNEIDVYSVSYELNCGAIHITESKMLREHVLEEFSKEIFNDWENS